MIETLLVRSSYSREYHLYIYKQEGEKKYFAKPVHIRFSSEPFTDGMSLPSPALSLPDRSISSYLKDLEVDNKALLNQKDKDKNDHIANLNDIIKLVMK